jgi:hypothetical protein
MKKNKVSKNLGKFEVAANLNTNMENTQEVDKSKVKQKSVSKKSKIKGKK